MSTLVADGKEYHLWSPPDEEKDFRPIVEQHVDDIFGKPSYVFNLRTNLKTVAGKGGIPDEFVLSLSNPLTLWVVENELERHPVYDHVAPQLGRFMNALKNPVTQMELTKVLYDEIIADSSIEAEIRSRFHPRDTYKFVSDLIPAHVRFSIVIDDETPELDEVYENLPKRPELVVVLRTYLLDPTNPKIHACVITPLLGRVYGANPTVPSAPLSLRATTYPKTWAEMLSWAEPSCITLLNDFKLTLKTEFGVIAERPIGKYLGVYSSRSDDNAKIFCVILLKKKNFNVRIGTDSTFTDPYHMTHPMKGWFFKGRARANEMDFEVKSIADFPKAIELVRHSFGLISKRR
jgi:hypothetical protein